MIITVLIAMIILANVFMFFSIAYTKKKNSKSPAKWGYTFMEFVFVANVIAIFWGCTK